MAVRIQYLNYQIYSNTASVKGNLCNLISFNIFFYIYNSWETILKMDLFAQHHDIWCHCRIAHCCDIWRFLLFWTGRILQGNDYGAKCQVAGQNGPFSDIITLWGPFVKNIFKKDEIQRFYLSNSGTLFISC